MNNNRIKKIKRALINLTFMWNYKVCFSFCNLLKESEILIENVRDRYRGVRIISYKEREVRRFPYHTQGLVTTFANPTLAAYPRIRSVWIGLNNYPEKIQFIMPILNQLKTKFHRPRLWFHCEINEKPIHSIHSMNTAKLLDVFSTLFEMCHHSPQYMLIIKFKKEQSPPVQEFINALLDLIQMVECIKIGISIITKQNFVFPIQKIVHWLYRPQQTSVPELEIELKLSIEVGEVQNTKDIVERLKKVICWNVLKRKRLN